MKLFKSKIYKVPSGLFHVLLEKNLLKFMQLKETIVPRNNYIPLT